MNLVIDNYGHFRLTDYGKGKFSLYNRRSDHVMDIDKTEYAYIKQSAAPHLACIEVDRWFNGKRRKPEGMDVT